MARYEIYPLEAGELCRALGIDRSLTKAQRDAIDDNDFAWPEEQKYPINSQAHLDAAAKLIGRAPADKQAAIKARAIKIAKRKGFTLPESWQEDDKDDAQERSMTKKTEEALTRAAANHDPFTGTHTHAHPANDSQGGDETHEHEHTHNNDADHSHSHSDNEERAADGTIQASERPTMYAPFLRIDAAKREVIGQATAEVPDSYKTIFGYYPKAFELWRGNIREQHDPKKAVGRRVDFFPHDDTRSVDLQSRVSRGAPDTWAKVEDNVLTGYSLSVIPDPEFGNDISKWPKKEYEGKMYPYLPRYSIAEVSLVDNPACPGCNIQIVRADGFATDVLDLTEEETPAAPEPEVIERAGARVSSDTRSAMHKGIGHTLHAAVNQMQNCGCVDCQAAMKMIDPDGDGDIDMGGYDDPDNDAAQLYGGPSTDTERALSGMIERLLEQKLSAVSARLQGIAGTLARSNAAPTTSLDTIISGAITRAVEAANTANESSLTEVRASLGAVKEQVEAIANTPVPGAPIMNASAMSRPALPKQLPTDPIRDPYARPASTGSSVADAMRQLSEMGYLNTEQRQVDAMAAGLFLQQQARSGR